jgi:hypothetical protein
MRQELLIIPRWEVGALVRPPRFRAMQSALNDRLSYIHHRSEFQCGNQFGVERVASIIETDVAKPFLQFAQFSGRLLQRVAGAVYTRTLFHRPLHLFPYFRDSLAPSGLAQELVL